MGKIKDLFFKHPIGASVTASIVFAITLQPLTDTAARWLGNSARSGSEGLARWILDKLAITAARSSPSDLYETISFSLFGVSLGIGMAILLGLRPNVVNSIRRSIQHDPSRMIRVVFATFVVCWFSLVILASLRQAIGTAMRRAFERDLTVAKFGIAPHMEDLARARAARATTFEEWHKASVLVKSLRKDAEARMDRPSEETEPEPKVKPSGT